MLVLKLQNLQKERAGFYGTIGGVTDFVVSIQENKTIAQTFGYGEDYEGNELKGSAKAAEDFKQKIKFGAEGTLLGGGVVTALPVAGTLGFKYGIKPAGKAIAFAGGLHFKALDYTIVNPLTKVIGTEFIGKGVSNRFIYDQTVDKAKKRYT